MKKTVHPLTSLKGFTSSYRSIATLIKENRIFALLYVDIIWAEGFKHELKSVERDHAVQFVAGILVDAVRIFGSTDDMLGHLQLDSFVIVTTAGRAEIVCKKIIEDFDNRVGTSYVSAGSVSGHARHKVGQSQMEKKSIASLSIAVITNEKRVIDSLPEVIRISDQMRNYVKSLPGSNYRFDRRESDTNEPADKARRYTSPRCHRDIRAVQGALSRVSLLYQALAPSVTLIKRSVDSLLESGAHTLDSSQRIDMELIQRRTDQLLGTLNELANVGGVDWTTTDFLLGKASLMKVIHLAADLAQGSGERRGEVHIERIEVASEPVVDPRDLIQVLFYILRNEIKLSKPGDYVGIGVSKETRKFVSVQIVNRERYIPRREIAALLRFNPSLIVNRRQGYDIRWAIVMAESFGGMIRVASGKEEGTTYTVEIPTKWSSHVNRINSMQYERAKSGKSARYQLNNIRHLLASTVKAVPPVENESLQNLEINIRELEILCNLSLLLADDLASDLERQFDKSVSIDAGNLGIFNAIMGLIRRIMRSMHAGDLFDPDSALRVSRYALAIADRLKIPKDEQLSLHQAALLKDLGYAIAPLHVLGRIEGLTPMGRSGLQKTLSDLLKILSQVDFLQSALMIIANEYERYDGTGSPRGVKGDEIPLGARIIAVAEYFATLAWGLMSLEGLDPEAVAKKLAADSSRQFDPHVVKALLQAWRKGELAMKDEIMSL